MLVPLQYFSPFELYSPAAINSTLDLCRNFCQTLFESRVHENEPTDSVLRGEDIRFLYHIVSSSHEAKSSGDRNGLFVKRMLVTSGDVVQHTPESKRGRSFERGITRFCCSGLLGTLRHISQAIFNQAEQQTSQLRHSLRGELRNCYFSRRKASSKHFRFRSGIPSAQLQYELVVQFVYYLDENPLFWTDIFDQHRHDSD
ncbi:unnamed protein product [Aspergillus oryzae RIB40]|uniref:DNA, SC020 n=2 Tax=Aspergillus oryzae TaxID=5062 RepID=Q2U5B4_ASPOR|nr:unnamed protein product [Aspergillus oryzae RIB40]EIT77860.1 hypothetical protein Ao3042_05986 [Aspergillus oryzae 3.042]KDE75809.1 hypothetical protein AO1008_01588 [Aspergillus oryzae 100-8]BAE63251.1 unnamed protein product [Aspergillus oryzae RIB40]|eukprot:EIT77860.1 hypothetical protein Ao3042_05986 [Aspergillus oryzae 3.042]